MCFSLASSGAMVWCEIATVLFFFVLFCYSLRCAFCYFPSFVAFSFDLKEEEEVEVVSRRRRRRSRRRFGRSRLVANFSSFSQVRARTIVVCLLFYTTMRHRHYLYYLLYIVYIYIWWMHHIVSKVCMGLCVSFVESTTKTTTTTFAYTCDHSKRASNP